MRTLALVAVFGGGCVAGVRAGLLASVDTVGHPGAMISLGGSIGPAIGQRGGIIATATFAGGIERPHPVTGELGASLAVEGLGDWQHIAFRAGPRIGFTWIDGAERTRIGAAFGGTLGILPTVHLREGHSFHCDNRTTYHVGLTVDGDYGRADHLGHFAFGPSFEMYTLARCN